MNDREPVTSIGELSVHVFNLKEQLADFRRAQSDMVDKLATKSDIDSLRSSMLTLATRPELHQEVSAINGKIQALKDELDRIKPSTILRQLTAILAALAAFGAVAALVLSLGGWVSRVPQHEVPSHYPEGRAK